MSMDDQIGTGLDGDDEPDVEAISLAKVFQSQMVLQRAPHKSIVYGTATRTSAYPGRLVTVEMSTAEKTFNYSSWVQWSSSGLSGVWNVTLDPMPANTTVNITVRSGTFETNLDDVIFGDVWLCSGQDNMQLTVGMMEGGESELADAHNYPGIRLMTVAPRSSKTPLDELEQIQQNWTPPSNDSLGGKDWRYFSAVCWIYGKTIHKELGVPIGLISTAWRHTSIDVWSSADALSECGLDPSPSQSEEGPNNPPADETTLRSQTSGAPAVPDATAPGGGASQAWNAMIHPLTRMSIYGAVWYQGEADTQAAARGRYNCSFFSMINDWRDKFSSASGQTDPEFPFGFVQLAPNHNRTKAVGFPDIRWHQTSDKGYVPNLLLRRVFMAVAMDLPDFKSPFSSVHPRDKQDVGRRLAQSGLAIAYGSNCIFQGPFPYTGAPAGDVLNVSFTSPITVESRDGFEWLCHPRDEWVSTSIVHYNETSVSLDATTCPKETKISGVRYAWGESPCAFKKCAIYGVADLTLPAPPFVLELQVDDDDETDDFSLEFDTPAGSGIFTFREF